MLKHSRRTALTVVNNKNNNNRGRSRVLPPPVSSASVLRRKKRGRSVSRSWPCTPITLSVVSTTSSEVHFSFSLCNFFFRWIGKCVCVFFSGSIAWKFFRTTGFFFFPFERPGKNVESYTRVIVVNTHVCVCINIVKSTLNVFPG